ncbi:TPA: RNA-directed DNA polymerase, partial [Vibrio vulnificus]|nr:RNA-directed DNA polymerase [Vibrio vulnificus]
SYSYRKDFQRCVGRVNKLARVHHEKHKPLMNRLRKIRPKPSEIDLKISKKILSKLKMEYDDKKDKYWYKKQYWQLVDRVNLISSTYHKEACYFRNELKNIKPEFD